MKLGEVLDRTVRFFQEKGFSSARLDAELLISQALKAERIRLYLDFDRPLTEAEMANCRDLVRRRTSGEPVAYITGKKGFFGLDFEVSPAVLIPRPETEMLVEEAMAFAKKLTEAPIIVDLGVGSGCVGISCLRNISNATLIGVDISSEALSVARKNAELLGVSDRAQFFEADACQVSSVGKVLSDDQKIDIVVANPPYIVQGDKNLEENVRRFEPAAALYGGKDGVQIPTEWLKAWSPALADRSVMLMEIGMEQGPVMKKVFEDSGIFSDVSVLKDLAGLDRVIKGVRNG